MEIYPLLETFFVVVNTTITPQPMDQLKSAMSSHRLMMTLPRSDNKWHTRKIHRSKLEKVNKWYCESKSRWLSLQDRVWSINYMYEEIITRSSCIVTPSHPPLIAFIVASVPDQPQLVAIAKRTKEHTWGQIQPRGHQIRANRHRILHASLTGAAGLPDLIWAAPKISGSPWTTCYKWCRKQREVKEIKPQGDTRFNVENPPNTSGKNHGRQPAGNFTMIGVRLQKPTAAAYKK
jgi:hypothetical protein